MAGKRSHNRTPAEVEERVVALARQGKSIRETAEATGLHTNTVRRIVSDTPGVEWGRVNQGSSGTPESAARARGYRSQYAKNRRDAIAEKLLDQAERAAERAAVAESARDFAYYMQGGDAAIRAYDKVTKTDQTGDGGAERAKSVMGNLIVALTGAVGENGAREGLVTE
ncbi:helix-turn-helix domain-containing protein [Microbacterium sp. AZCO]|uniref:helix-turn-helix domain-containing protein n=1 Tax=Microbacterium sp. AZCO TaxID=3142976 RepID=UPI0031F37151